MGSVTILGEEFDIATTTELSISIESFTEDEFAEIGKLVNLTDLKLTTDEISENQISKEDKNWLKTLQTVE